MLSCLKAKDGPSTLIERYPSSVKTQENIFLSQHACKHYSSKISYFFKHAKSLIILVYTEALYRFLIKSLFGGSDSSELPNPKDAQLITV